MDYTWAFNFKYKNFHRTHLKKTNSQVFARLKQNTNMFQIKNWTLPNKRVKNRKMHKISLTINHNVKQVFSKRLLYMENEKDCKTIFPNVFEYLSYSTKDACPTNGKFHKLDCFWFFGNKNMTKCIVQFRIITTINGLHKQHAKKAWPSQPTLKELVNVNFQLP
jgi:hypothetical protein